MSCPFVTNTQHNDGHMCTYTRICFIISFGKVLKWLVGNFEAIITCIQNQMEQNSHTDSRGFFSYNHTFPESNFQTSNFEFNLLITKHPNEL